jgi:hypothetical protein
MTELAPGVAQTIFAAGGLIILLTAIWWVTRWR